VSDIDVLDDEQKIEVIQDFNQTVMKVEKKRDAKRIKRSAY
jgi:hypothetical protein